jgi:hypothetical protein
LTLFAVFLFNSAVAFGQSNTNCVSPKQFGAVGNGSADDTVAIKNWIASGSKCLTLDTAIYKITSTIVIGPVSGLSMTGASKGENAYMAGSSFLWAGPANGIMMQMSTVQSSNFSGFTLDGNNTAGIGLKYTAVNSQGSTHYNNLHNIGINNIMGSPGYGLYVGSPNNDDISSTEFRDMIVRHTNTAIFQEGAQTVHIFYNMMFVTAFANYGGYFKGGDVRLKAWDIAGASTAIDDIYVGTGADWASIYDMYHEVLPPRSISGHAYNFPGTGRVFPTLMSGVRVLWGLGGGNPVFFNQYGPITITAMSVDGGGSGVVQLVAAAHGSQVTSSYYAPGISCAGTACTAVAH